MTTSLTPQASKPHLLARLGRWCVRRRRSLCSESGSRIKEEYDRTGDNGTAVAVGLAVTARVITAAALIMVCVFSAFALGDDRSLKLFGLGLASAVAIDATIVRMLLVPATMELLGSRNWWIPKWIDKLLPKIDVEGYHHVAPIAGPSDTKP